MNAESDTSQVTPRRASAAEPKPHPRPLQLLGDPDATICTGDSCEIPANTPTT